MDPFGALQRFIGGGNLDPNRPLGEQLRIVYRLAAFTALLFLATGLFIGWGLTR